MTIHECAMAADGACSSVFGVSIDDIRGRSKVPVICDARHTAWALVRASGFTLQQIGAEYGVNHSTVIAAFRRLEALLSMEDDLRSKFGRCARIHRASRNILTTTP